MTASAQPWWRGWSLIMVRPTMVSGGAEIATASLAAKLGVSPTSRMLVVGPAPDAVVAELFDPQRRATAKPYEVILAFCPDRKALDRCAATLPDRLTVAGGLWLCWYK